jgi:hypothetical protein
LAPGKAKVNHIPKPESMIMQIHHPAIAYINVIEAVVAGVKRI